jgi:regulatory protein
MISWGKNSALYRLARKMMSESELSKAIARKAVNKFDGITPELAKQIAAATIAHCNELRLLDDVTYAEVKTASSLRAGRSRKRIAMDLSNKGIDPDLIATSLEDADDLGAGLNFARRRAFGPYRKVDLDEKRKVKEFSAFARNGFSSEVARKVMTMTIEDIEDTLDTEAQWPL